MKYVAIFSFVFLSFSGNSFSQTKFQSMRTLGTCFSYWHQSKEPLKQEKENGTFTVRNLDGQVLCQDRPTRKKISKTFFTSAYEKKMRTLPQERYAKANGPHIVCGNHDIKLVIWPVPSTGPAIVELYSKASSANPEEFVSLASPFDVAASRTLTRYFPGQGDAGAKFQYGEKEIDKFSCPSFFRKYFRELKRKNKSELYGTIQTIEKNLSDDPFLPLTSKQKRELAAVQFSLEEKNNEGTPGKYEKIVRKRLRLYAAPKQIRRAISQ